MTSIIEEKIKCVLIGASGSGKTSIMTRYMCDKFSEDIHSTIGASFFSQSLNKNDKKIRLEIWDTAGQERFDSLMPLYYRGSDIVLVVYDITSYDTFKKAKEWIKTIVNDETINPIFVLIGNKYDLEEKRSVKYEEAFSYAEERNILFLETSAKTSRNIKDIFDKSLDIISLNKKKKDPLNKKIIDKNIIDNESQNSNNSYFSSCIGIVNMIGIIGNNK